MVFTWRQRLERLRTLLPTSPSHPEDDDSPVNDFLGQSLERYSEQQKLGGRNSKGAEVENLRFSNRDLVSQGTLATGQFGMIDIVRCQLNGFIYARKTIKKASAIRFREQCSVQFERELLTLAAVHNSPWAPHLVCSFQTPTDLNLLMDYAEGGSLADVLGSAPDGKLDESDLLWWMPQAIAAISWCHAQNFVHRDIKPENFVLTTSAHLKLIDFGCAAPLLPADPSGVQLVPKQYCLVPCGTCDYIAPEILQAHEEALVAAESGEVVDADGTGGYGREVDWWSLGAMMYELGCGMAPFFARDIQQTYLKIVEHEKHPIQFKDASHLSSICQELIKSFLLKNEKRLGRKSIYEIKRHPFLNSIKWAALHLQPAPPDLTIPKFNYTNGPPAAYLSVSQCAPNDISSDPPFAFSAFFQSSPGMSSQAFTPAQSFRQVAPALNPLSAFIGFTWGPLPEAFDYVGPPALANGSTPGPNRRHSLHASTTEKTPMSVRRRPMPQHHLTDPNPGFTRFSTPIRPSLAHLPTTIPRTGGTATARRLRDISDREALRMMLDCVGASARKKVLESGKKPRSSLNNMFMPLPALSMDAPTPKAVAAAKGVENISIPDNKEQPTRLGRKNSAMTLQLRSSPLAVSTSTTASNSPPSPSPRPGSAMSRRSATPGLTSTFKSHSAVIDSSGHRTTRSRDWTSEFKSGPNGTTSRVGDSDIPNLTKLLPSPASFSRPQDRTLPSPSGIGKNKGFASPGSISFFPPTPSARPSSRQKSVDFSLGPISRMPPTPLQPRRAATQPENKPPVGPVRRASHTDLKPARSPITADSLEPPKKMREKVPHRITDAYQAKPAGLSDTTFDHMSQRLISLEHDISGIERKISKALEDLRREARPRHQDKTTHSAAQRV